jgi:signal transduction histidine kinase
LHSDRQLAHFEKIVNGLVERLRSYKHELSRWVFFQTEESRYRALGELSALIVHDLSAPLHVIHFCTEQAKEDPEILRNPRYIDQLTVNGTRSLELINSLKAYLKDGKFKSSGITYAEAHRQVIRLLETQFHSSGFAKIVFDTAPEAVSIRVDIPKADLIHVLMNLYSNSVLNLLQNGVEAPAIRVKLFKSDANDVTYLIEDNGTGLSEERFEELTAFSFLPGSDGYSRDGLGLRLVRRLVERNRGSLRAVGPPPSEQGSRFHLTLKCFINPDQADQNGKTSAIENIKKDLGD